MSSRAPPPKSFLSTRAASILIPNWALTSVTLPIDPAAISSFSFKNEGCTLKNYPYVQCFKSRYALNFCDTIPIFFFQLTLTKWLP